MIQEFLQRSGLSMGDITNRSRRPEIVAARQLLWKILREKTGSTYEFIGKLTGYDCSTVIKGIRAANDRIEIKDAITMDIWEKVNV